MDAEAKAFVRDVKELAGLLSDLQGRLMRMSVVLGRVAAAMDTAAEREGSPRRIFPLLDDTVGMIDSALSTIISALDGGDLK